MTLWSAPVNGACKRKLCVELILIPSAPADSLHKPLGYLCCTFLPELIDCACARVFVGSKWGLFRGFTAAPSGCVCQRRNLGICSSNKREREDRKGEKTGQWAFSEGLRMISPRCGEIFYPVHRGIPFVCVVYICTQNHRCQLADFWTTLNGEGVLARH